MLLTWLTNKADDLVSDTLGNSLMKYQTIVLEPVLCKEELPEFLKSTTLPNFINITDVTMKLYGYVQNYDPHLFIKI